jgi:hypothetical protein
MQMKSIFLLIKLKFAPLNTPKALDRLARKGKENTGETREALTA